MSQKLNFLIEERVRALLMGDAQIMIVTGASAPLCEHAVDGDSGRSCCAVLTKAHAFALCIDGTVRVRPLLEMRSPYFQPREGVMHRRLGRWPCGAGHSSA